MEVTRRRLGRLLAAAAATPAVLPIETLAQQPAQAPSEQNLKVAREELRVYSQQLAGVDLPMSTEPAFRFKP